jgi:hypothetical protein
MLTNTKSFLYYGAAACTGIAGILHLILVPNGINFNINNAVFFLVAGIAQLFWVLPMIEMGEDLGCYWNHWYRYSYWNLDNNQNS